MTRAEIKEKAKESLKGRWGTAVLFVLVYMVVIFLANYISGFIPLVGPIAYSIVSVAVSYNVMVYFIKFRRGEEVGLFDFITKIPENFAPAWKVVGGVLLKMLPYVIAIVVLYIVIIAAGVGTLVSASMNSTITGRTSVSTASMAGGGAIVGIAAIALFVVGILAAIKGLYYSFANYIMYDSGNTLTGKEAAAKSEAIMEGHRADYFVFTLSFIGWAILAGFTLYIGMLWLMPYIQVATVIFYESLIGKKDDEKEVEVQATIEEKKDDNVDPIQ